MRNGQNKRMRGRNNNNNNRRGHNPLTRVYESNGPDVKIRGTASHVAEKYLQLARDAQSSGDPVGAENYYQHAEHYFRLIAAAQEQFRQNTPFQNRPEGSVGNDMRDESFEDMDDELAGSGEQPSYGTRDPQPFLPRDAQFFNGNEQQGGNGGNGQRPHHNNGPNGPQPAPQGGGDDFDRLPSFITGGQPQGQPQNFQPHGQNNGYDNQGDRNQGSGDRFGYRRRRRHRGPRNDTGPHGSGHDGGDDTGPQN